ncbi:hypothetical protein [Stenotrophomonas maltophilia]|uniref:hypothetical protein n=1 Tax=Stenotrophomonas maltophilia TaxID=40324 RepID=UPI0013DD5B7D|nr:hypothetical protein [Stenotrophomonas maltophilia]
MDETVYDAAWRAYKAAPRAVANGPSRLAIRAAVDAVLGYLMPPGSTPAFFADRELRRAVAADLMEMGSESQRGHWPAMRATYTVPLFRLPPELAASEGPLIRRNPLTKKSQVAAVLKDGGRIVPGAREGLRRLLDHAGQEVPAWQTALRAAQGARSKA